MPRYDTDMEKFTAPGNFQFSGTSIGKLQSSQYTLVTLCIDATPSVMNFKDLIIKTIKNMITGCTLNKVIVDNLLIRVVYFNSTIGIRELHGYKELNRIDIDNDYENIEFLGMTNLNDAVFENLEVNDKYSKDLSLKDFDNNSIVFVLTDGIDNYSSKTQIDIKNKLDDVKRKEITESILMLLIGLNTDDQISAYLDNFKSIVGFDDYIDAKELTAEKSAKISNFIVSQVSSQSSSLGTGSPSQVLKF